MLLTATLPGSLKVFGKTKDDSNDSENNAHQGTLERLGGMSLQGLLDYHHKYLNETYIPNWNRGVDWKYGGFADVLIPGQEPDFERKSMYYQGRAVWIFSYLYNNISHNERHLEAAVKGRDFLIKHALTDDFRWISSVTRKGEHLSEPLDHYGDIYMIQGLTELFKATNDEKDLKLAIQTAHSVMDRLVSPSYQHVDAHGPTLEPGTRRLASWQHFLGALTPLLMVRRDPAIERIARYCVRVIYEHHWIPEYGVLLEVLDDHFRPFTFDAPNWGGNSNRSVSGWHSIEACWMPMDEAVRVNHYPTFRQGMEMGFSTLEKCYVDGKGLVVMLNNPEAKSNPEGPFSPWRALDDVLVFCLMVIEHIHDPMAISYYNKCFELYNSKPENFTPQCLLHVPRRFFYSINILNRMIENGGKISGLFG
jgi:mannose/cellobiose epimerase-like protein (N-acyl-D-glucosamine 2-epimerase family)